MKKLRTRLLGMTAACALAMGHVEPAAAQNIGAQMDSMFNTLTSVVPPTGVETLRRGGLYGGRLRVRARTMQAQFISATPPSFRAGCGGIDFFGGSFSFINLDQFTQLLRSIASAALGYAFMLALQNVCPICATTIAQLQRIIQELNQLNANSCQLAQGLVNDTLTAMNFAHQRGQSDHSIKDGITGAFDAFWGITQNIEDQVLTTTMTDEVQGNLGWLALEESGAVGWFSAGGNDLLHAVLTITGTVIVGPLEADGETVVNVDGDEVPAGRSNRLTFITGSTTLKVEDIMRGSTNAAIMRCFDETSRCDEGVTRVTTDINGFVERLDAQMEGTLTGDGILDRMTRNPGSLTVADRAFLEVTMKWSQLAALLYELAAMSPTNSTAPHTLWAEAKELIAYELVKGMFQEVFDAMDQAANSDYLAESDYRAQFMEELERSRGKVNTELMTIAEQIPNQGDVYSRFFEIRSYLASLQQVRLD